MTERLPRCGYPAAVLRRRASYWACSARVASLLRPSASWPHTACYVGTEQCALARVQVSVSHNLVNVVAITVMFCWAYCYWNVGAALPFAGGKTEDFLSAAKLFHRAKGRKVKVPTYLVPATQQVCKRAVPHGSYCLHSPSIR